MLSKTKLIKSNWYFIALISIVAIFITSSPLIVSFFYSQANNLVISGLHSLTPGDTNVYFSYINQIKNGSWLLNNQFNFTPQSLGIFNIFWLLVGLSAKVLNLSALVSFQLWRILLIPILIFSLFKLTPLFIKDKLWQKISLILITFSSGLGIYLNFLHNKANNIYYRPLDLWMPEITIFNTIFHTPHFIASTILIISIFYFYLQALNQKKYLFSIIAGLLALVLFNFHPYHFPLIYCSLLAYSIYLLFEKKKKLVFLFFHFSLLFLISIPSIFYHFYTLTDPIISARGLQNITINSPLIFTVIGLGLPFIGAWLGSYLSVKKNNPYQIFLFIWFITGLLLSFVPNWQFGRRSLHSISIPAILLSIFWFQNFSYKYKFDFKKQLTSHPIIIALIFVTILAPTSIFNLSRDIKLYINQHPFFYYSTSKKQTLLEINNLPHSNFISSDVNSNFIVGHTNKHVFWGHDHESLNSKNKKRLQNKLFSGQLSSNQIYSILVNLNVHYLWWDDFEKNIYPNFTPDDYNFFHPIISSNSITVYQIIPQTQ